MEKSVERCVLSIIEGENGDAESDEEVDSLESKLVVKLLCKHGRSPRHVTSIDLKNDHRSCKNPPFSLICPLGLNGTWCTRYPKSSPGQHWPYWPAEYAGAFSNA